MGYGWAPWFARPILTVIDTNFHFSVEYNTRWVTFQVWSVHLSRYSRWTVGALFTKTNIRLLSKFKKNSRIGQYPRAEVIICYRNDDLQLAMPELIRRLLGQRLFEEHIGLWSIILFFLKDFRFFPAMTNEKNRKVYLITAKLYAAVMIFMIETKKENCLYSRQWTTSEQCQSSHSTVVGHCQRRGREGPQNSDLTCARQWLIFHFSACFGARKANVMKSFFHHR